MNEGSGSHRTAIDKPTVSKGLVSRPQVSDALPIEREPLLGIRLQYCKRENWVEGMVFSVCLSIIICLIGLASAIRSLLGKQHLAHYTLLVDSPLRSCEGRSPGGDITAAATRRSPAIKKQSHRHNLPTAGYAMC